MESRSSVLSNEQAKSNSHNTLIYTNDQQPNEPFSFNVESRFSPRTNSDLFSIPISELLDFHKNRLHKQMKYAIMVFGVVSLIGLALLIASFALPKCNRDIDSCSSMNLVFLVTGSCVLGTGILLLLIVGGCGFYNIKKQFRDLNDTESGQQPTIWRLDGEEWRRYLSYIYGPDREWTEMDPISSFCCRRSSYDRLMDRQYGHIVLYGNSLIIDELYFISFRTFSLQGVQLLAVDQHQQIRGLRIHTYLKAGKNSRNCYFDVFAPSSVSLEQLTTIAQSYNGKLSGPNGLHVAMEGLHLTAFILNTLR